VDEPSEEHLFDWVSARALGQDADAAQALLHYTENLLRTNMGAEAVRDLLRRAGLSATDADALVGQAAALLRATRASGPPPSAPVPFLRSGAYDFGGVFDHLYRQEAERRERRLVRKERKEKSARLAITEPDPAFALDGLPTYAQVLTREARKADRKDWILGIIVLIVVMLPFLFFGIAALCGVFP
jgi:hypothetical protein